MRMGALEDVERSENSDLAVKIYIGQRSASVSTVDTSPATLDALMERAVAMARLAPENPWAGLAPEELLLKGDAPDLDQVDPHGEPPVERLRAMALEAEDAARAIDGVTNSDGASAGFSIAHEALVTSHGFAGCDSATGVSLSASVIAGTGGGMQRDHDWHSARHLADLDAAQKIGMTAGTRAVGRLNPGTMGSGRKPVLFDARVAGSLIGHLLSAMAGPVIARRKSFLLEREGARLFPADIVIDEDPLRPRGLKSHAFDAEGVATKANRVVDAGVIGGWRCDAAAARQLGLSSTGHSGGNGAIASSNLAMRPGSLTRDELMADVQDGVLVTELIGQGVDPLTGDYSRGASGWRIVNGQLAGPVAGFTIAGNLIDIYADLAAANDLNTRFSVHVPTLRTDSMTIAGD